MSSFSVKDGTVTLKSCNSGASQKNSWEQVVPCLAHSKKHFKTSLAKYWELGVGVGCTVGQVTSRAKRNGRIQQISVTFVKKKERKKYKQTVFLIHRNLKTTTTSTGLFFRSSK